MRFRLVSHNGSMFNPATITLSTVELAEPGFFETCVFFSDGTIELLQKYTNREDAVKGHAKYSKESGLK